jgi:hypothetical protein
MNLCGRFEILGDGRLDRETPEEEPLDNRANPPGSAEEGRVPRQRVSENESVHLVAPNTDPTSPQPPLALLNHWPAC